jgi:acetyl-CoA synthetase
LRVVARDGSTSDVTYRELRGVTNRFANGLSLLGVPPGAGVFVLLDRSPELFVSVLGAFKHGNVVTPLFPAFGPHPIRQRLLAGHARVLVTTPSHFRRKVEAIRSELPELDHVLLAGPRDGTPPAGTRWLDEVMTSARDAFEIPSTDPEQPALVHFTSGTTGAPKGAIHVHEAVVAHHATSAAALDLHADDVFWCTADPGWVTGMSYGIIAPLSHGATAIVDARPFEAARWYRILQDQSVTVWYTAPTAIRMLMRAGPEVARSFDLGSLRFIASVGEALEPEAISWSREVLGRPIHDNWWQTETGGIMIANVPGLDIRPGSMGRPLPGVEVAILAADPDPEREGQPLVRGGRPVPVDDPGATGHLALRRGWPSMFRGYVDEPERYRACFVDDWYVSGDLARRDEDGYVWFVGRADDVIKSAGHLIGPFEVESTLREHPAVADVGVIGVPDPVAGQVVKAYVSVQAGYEPGEELATELLGFARARLGPSVAPREIAFDQHLPTTNSGKIMRRLLRARALGLAEGDTSTMAAIP